MLIDKRFRGLVIETLCFTYHLVKYGLWALGVAYVVDHFEWQKLLLWLALCLCTGIILSLLPSNRRRKDTPDRGYRPSKGWGAIKRKRKSDPKEKI